MQLLHGIPVQPVRISLLDGCELTIAAAPASTAMRLAAVRNTLLYNFVGTGIHNLITDYTGISEQISGQRVLTSLRQRIPQMRPAALSTLTRPRPYDLDFLLHLEATTLRYRTMRVRALNSRTSAVDATSRLTRAERALADALARQIADAISVYGHDSRHNAAAWRLKNARDHAAALIHRLGGRAIDSYQVVAMLAAAGARQRALQQDYVTRRDLIQRETDDPGNIRVNNLKHDGLAVFYPAGVITPAQALADYATQRAAKPRGRLPIPTPATTTWCRCPYCSPTTTFTPISRAAIAAAIQATPTPPSGAATAPHPPATAASGHP
ncbi:hypothetical protein [Geodermatophilus sabuli]|uniref:hypothetical protein n=1 Tax=Geodermatophilus sabuli TaxID=1564158 RepID=UPI000BE2CBCE|nr:hypothetical protein [Geodermatophilus sabuli]MBB3084215.1 hypothetical protein [Geodermatophilus sabuli]